jgi:hypothetical protein
LASATAAWVGILQKFAAKFPAAGNSPRLRVSVRRLSSPLHAPHDKVLLLLSPRKHLLEAAMLLKRDHPDIDHVALKLDRRDLYHPGHSMPAGCYFQWHRQLRPHDAGKSRISTLADSQVPKASQVQGEEAMPRIGNLRLGRAALLIGLAAGSLAVVGPSNLMVTPAHAQASVSVGADFRVALEPYGAWHHHRRFGDVWVPANRARDWRPYTVGHWVYTDDYGWYWVTDDQEADWGWITYHYGRWHRDADYGWFWVPDDVWGPAWVDWRYGDQYIGWAPEPPDDVFDEVQDEPVYWSFVTAGDLIAPSIATVLLPFDRRVEFFRRTALVNRPVMMRGPERRFAVDPGIPPGNIAALRGRPLPTYRVRPRVLAGTATLPGAIQVRAADLRREGGNRPAARERLATRDIIRSSSTVRPARAAPQPEPLGRGEVGRLGATPPRAARNAAVEQGTAQRVPGTPSAQRQGEQRQTASPQGGRGTEQRRGNIASPNAPPPTAQVPAGPREGRVEQRAGGSERNQPLSAAERRARERTPVVRAPSVNQSIVQHGPAARPPANRPAAIAPPPRVNRPPAIAARPPVNRPPAAPPTVNRPPAFAARPPSRPVAPPAAAPRPAPPPAAFARPAAPPPAARPSTVGAAPHGGPGQRRPQ